MKFSTFFTTAILLLSAAADAFPQPVADSTSLTLNPIPHSKRNPAGPQRQPAELPRPAPNPPATKQKASSSSEVCLLPSARGKKGLGKRACGPDPKEKLTNCSLCPGLKKRGKGQRSKNKNVLVLSAPAKDNVDDLVDDVDCWQCTNASGQLVKFTGPQVKRAAVDALKRNLSGSLITYDRGDLGAKEWPHYYGNAEGALPAAGGDLSKYITFPLLVAGSYTGGNPGAFRVTIGLSANEIPQTLNVMKHPNGDSTTYVKVEKGKK
ncbi:hypothetical protein P167DRAFT_579628 [Morchella conica CCBAS932]|uniref:Uncharacterized protein n=1 Tax=Morchella conica CCBAS932 TaxID=1392247 RepID=A0A3N4KCL3_9PEZI|nr:hypothetical protein P167DRAFT_579628 [Morchella conica CCBAS932]